MEEFVLYGGKGGVGKTTCAAATGVERARAGEEVLVVSTDPAHSLGDVLGTGLGSEPTAVEPGLSAVEPDPETGQEAYRAIVAGLAAELRSAGVRLEAEQIERLFTAGLVPGSDELAALELLGEFTADGWDRLVFDTAPTGHTLRLLTLPEVLAESLSVAGSLRQELRNLVASARSFILGPAAYLGRDEPDELDELRERMETVGRLLRNPDRTEFRVVLVPERLAIEESRRLVEQLRTFEVPVGTVVVNRVLEDVDESCDRCRARRERQAANLREIRETFPDQRVVTLPELATDGVGREELATLGETLSR